MFVGTLDKSWIRKKNSVVKDNKVRNSIIFGGGALIAAAVFAFTDNIGLDTLPSVLSTLCIFMAIATWILVRCYRYRHSGAGTTRTDDFSVDVDVDNDAHDNHGGGGIIDSGNNNDYADWLVQQVAMLSPGHLEEVG